MKIKLLTIVFLAAGSLLMGQISIRIGPPPPPRVYRVQPRRPGPDYVWIDGYWYPAGNRYRWHDGYWTRLPYAGARWVGPRYEGDAYHQGYWEGERGHFDHDHRWDRDRRNRDYGRYGGDRDHDRDRDRR